MSKMSPGIFCMFLAWVEFRVNVLLYIKNAAHFDVIF